MCLAIPGKIISTEDDGALSRRGTVDFGGVRREINLSLVPEAGVGDHVIVHAGFALNQIDEEEAREVLETLREMEALAETEEPPR